MIDFSRGGNRFLGLIAILAGLITMSGGLVFPGLMGWTVFLGGGMWVLLGLYAVIRG